MNICFNNARRFGTEKVFHLRWGDKIWTILTEMCACVHISDISVTEWCIVGHLFIALHDLWDGSIAHSARLKKIFQDRSGS